MWLANERFGQTMQPNTWYLLPQAWSITLVPKPDNDSSESSGSLNTIDSSNSSSSNSSQSTALSKSSTSSDPGYKIPPNLTDRATRDELVNRFSAVKHFLRSIFSTYVKMGFKTSDILSAFFEFGGDFEKMLEKLTKVTTTEPTRLDKLVDAFSAVAKICF